MTKKRDGQLPGRTRNHFGFSPKFVSISEEGEQAPSTPSKVEEGNAPTTDTRETEKEVEKTKTPKKHKEKKPAKRYGFSSPLSIGIPKEGEALNVFGKTTRPGVKKGRTTGASSTFALGDIAEEGAASNPSRKKKTSHRRTKAMSFVQPHPIEQGEEEKIEKKDPATFLNELALSKKLEEIIGQFLELEKTEQSIISLGEELHAAQEKLVPYFSSEATGEIGTPSEGAAYSEEAKERLIARLDNDEALSNEVNPLLLGISQFEEEIKRHQEQKTLETIAVQKKELLSQFREASASHLVDGAFPHNHLADDQYKTCLKFERQEKLQSLRAGTGEKERKEELPTETSSPSATPETKVKFSEKEASPLYITATKEGERSEYMKQSRQEQCKKASQRYVETNDYKETTGLTHEFFEDQHCTSPWTQRSNIQRQGELKSILKKSGEKERNTSSRGI